MRDEVYGRHFRSELIRDDVVPEQSRSRPRTRAARRIVKT